MLTELFGLTGLASAVRNSVSLENPDLSLTDPKTWEGIFATAKARSGVVVNHNTALDYDPVWQAVSIISGDVASLPLHVYRRNAENDREIDHQHDAEWLVSEQANSACTAYQFWRSRMHDALLWGNGYARIVRRNGRVAELLPLLPDRTAPEILTWAKLFASGVDPVLAEALDGTLVYVSEVGGKLKTYLPQDILHIMGLSPDGTKGYDLVAKARDSLGLGLASIGFASKFFARGGRIGGTLQIPIGTKKPARDNVETDFRKLYEDEDAAFKVVVLRDDFKFHAGQMSPRESQMVESRQEDRLAAASWFNLPPHKLGIKGSVSYNSHEQGELAYLTGCLRHWLMAIKTECQAKLLTEPQRRERTHYLDHVVEKMLQTDVQTTNTVLEIQRRNEVISANEWRQRINLPKRKDPGGDDYANPNTRATPPAPSGGNAAKPPAEEPPEDPRSNDQAKAAARANLADACARLARRIGAQARKASKSLDKFTAYANFEASTPRPWSDDFTEVVFPPLLTWRYLHNRAAELVDDKLWLALRNAECERLQPLLEPPYKAADLEAHVDRVMRSFEAIDFLSLLEKPDA